MLKNYFKIAFRNLIRHRIFTFINVLGLAIGLVCFILIMLWIQDELSFDRHNSNFEQIYRIGTDTKMGEQEETGTWTAIPLGPALMEEIPEIESAVRLKGNYENLVSFEETISCWIKSIIPIRKYLTSFPFRLSAAAAPTF